MRLRYSPLALSRFSGATISTYGCKAKIRRELFWRINWTMVLAMRWYGDSWKRVRNALCWISNPVFVDTFVQ